MGRRGITSEAMEAAAARLVERGEPVTKLTLRAELGGTGSYALILPWLRAYKERQQERQVVTGKATPLPEKVLGMIQQVWEVARSEADAEYTADREENRRALEAMQHEMTSAEEENTEALGKLESELEALQDRFDEAVSDAREQQHASQDRIAQLSHDLGTAQASEVAARQEIQARSSTIATLEEQLRLARIEATAHATSIATLEARLVAAEGRDQESQRRIVDLGSRLDQASSALEGYKAKDQESQRRISELTTRLDQAQGALDASKTQNAALKTRVAVAESESAAKTKTIERLDAELAEARQENKEQAARVAALSNQMASLTSDLLSARERLQQADPQKSHSKR